MLMRIRPKQFVFPRNYKLKKPKEAFLFYSFLTFVVYFSLVLFPFQLEKFCLLGAAHTLRLYILLEFQKQRDTPRPACYHLDLCLASMEHFLRLWLKQFWQIPPKMMFWHNRRDEKFTTLFNAEIKRLPTVFYLIYGWPLNCPFWIGA